MPNEYRKIPSGCKFWPESVSPAGVSIAAMYEKGFAGAWADDKAKADAIQSLIADGGYASAGDACRKFGLAGSGAGKLSILFPAVEKCYPGSVPGPAQERGDCVSHSSKNASLASLCNEIMFGTPDEVTGLREAAPDVPPAGVENGVLSSEFHYWYRGYSGDGWDCWSAAEVARKNGILLRKPYPELGIDLSVYSGALAGKFGRTAPPQKITDEGRLHCVRTVTQCEGLEQVRDLLANGYGCSSCGSEGFVNERDADGVSRRSGSWAHAMAYLGFDDRAETVRKHGCPLVLILNSWGIWNKGPRRIPGTQIDIPEGSFWAKWNEVKNREVIAYSSVNGWPQKKLPDYGFHVFG